MSCKLDFETAKGNLSLAMKLNGMHSGKQQRRSSSLLRCILLMMDVPVQLPIMVRRVDNVGAIFMSESHSTTGKTKHIDIRYNFVRQ
jgi:hypothetical protein